MIYDKLRPYQREAFDAAIEHIKKSKMPCLLELSTGSGKSWIVAAIAHWINSNTGKHVLCLQPSATLTKQNHEKYRETGEPASIFSASAGGKCTRYPIIYATPGTVKNSLSRFGNLIGAIIIDEAHSTTPTHKLIVDAIREKNPNVRVIGMTATPYTMRDGYVYAYDLNGKFMPEDEARDPYYNNLLYRIQTRELIDEGFLTEIHADPDHADSYDTSGLQLKANGRFDEAQIEEVFVGRGRLTYDIVKDVVEKSCGRMGVMLFAASVKHAQEIMESLPKDKSGMLGGSINTKRAEREALLGKFKRREIKYLVSVDTLSTGFDCLHVDVIAVLRKTESQSLFQQILGRALRLHPEKNDALLLDYAENISFHKLHNDLFTPEVKVKGSKEKGEPLEIQCPDCNYVNLFSARDNPDEYPISPEGYWLDLDGNQVEGDDGPIPAHYGRRCCGQVQSILDRGVYERCNFRWNGKDCPECQHANDIAARYCESCKEELVNPNEKLRIEFERVKRDPYSVSTDEVLEWSAKKTITTTGKDAVVCTYRTEYRSFDVWYLAGTSSAAAEEKWESLSKAVYKGHIAPDAATFVKYLDRATPPKTITYFRKKGNKFTEILAYNRPVDEVK